MKLKLNPFSKPKAEKNSPSIKVITIDCERISLANSEEIRAQCDTQLNDQSTVILDLKKLHFIDSSGLGLLVSLRKMMLPPQNLILEGITDPVIRELFSLTRMDQIFILSKDREESVQRFYNLS